MPKPRDWMHQDADLFGPGTDLVLSLAAILTLLVFVIAGNGQRRAARDHKRLASLESRIQTLQEQLAKKQQELDKEQRRLQKLEALLQKTGAGQLDLTIVRRNQMEIIHSIAGSFHATATRLAEDRYGIAIAHDTDPDIIIDNDVTLQRIRFGSHVLFESDEYSLRPQGRVALAGFVAGLRGQLNAIEEVQIQGHADPRRTRRHESNLHLAAKRAIEVFSFLTSHGIDPLKHLMSATSFGEFDPVTRDRARPFSELRLRWDNDTTQEQRLNRRIEIILIYCRTVDGLSGTAASTG